MKEFTITKNDAGQRLDRWLSKAVPLLPGNAADNDNALNSYIAKHMQEMKEIIKEVPMASLEFTTIKLSPVVRKERFDHMQKLIEKLEENFSVSMV